MVRTNIGGQSLTAVKVSKDASANAANNALHVAISDQTNTAMVGTGTVKTLHAGIHDGELLAAVKANSALADDLDGINGLVTASVIHGYVDDATTHTVLVDGSGHLQVDVLGLAGTSDMNVAQIAGTATTVNRGAAAAGTQRVVEALDRTVVKAAGAAAINTTTAFATVAFDLKCVTLHLDAALAAGETVYITLDSATDPGAQEYDAVLREYDLGTAGGTSFTYAPTVPIPCEAGDEIVVTMANSLSRNYGLRIVADVR